MAATELAAEAGEGETTLCSARGEPVCKTPVEDANEHAEPVDDACKGSKRSTGEGETKLCTTEDEAVMRAKKAEANRRAAMWAALDRKRCRGWSEAEETASRPVMPVGMSSMRLSPARLRLGEESLEGPEKPELAR